MKPGSTADIIWGNGTDETLGDKISITLIATGFDSKNKVPEDVAPRVIYKLGDQEAPKAAEVTKENNTPLELQEIQLVNSKKEEPVKEVTKITPLNQPEKKEDQRTFTFVDRKVLKKNQPVIMRCLLQKPLLLSTSLTV